MTYWVNVHYPNQAGEPRKTQMEVWLQAKGRQRPLMGDRVFIYETEELSRENIIKESKGRKEKVKLIKGAKGIIGLVELSSDVKKFDLRFNRVLYNGIYEIKEIPMCQDVISLGEIKQAYLKYKMGKTFTPHINTGLRKLKAKEIDVMCNLAGVKP